MNQNDKPAFAKIMAMMATAYRTEMSRDQMTLYALYLSNIPIGDIDAAVRRIIANRVGGYLPTIAEVRYEAAGMTESKIHLEADAAWDYTLQFIKGQYHAWLNSDLRESRPRLDVDSVICGTYGSWTNFMEALEADQMRFMKNDFVSTWMRRKQAAAIGELGAGSEPVGMLNPKGA